MKNTLKKLFTNATTVTFLVIGLGVVAAWAATPRYEPKSGSVGSAASPSYAIFQARDGLQVRIVNVNYDTDTNNSSLSFRYGTAAYRLTQTNSASSTNIVINQTNGLAPGDIVVLQKANGATYKTNVYATIMGAYTNLYLPPGGFGVAGAINDQLFLMSSASTIPASSDAAINGEAIFVAANAGRPVMLTLTPANVTNFIHTITARYE